MKPLKLEAPRSFECSKHRILCHHRHHSTIVHVQSRCTHTLWHWCFSYIHNCTDLMLDFPGRGFVAMTLEGHNEERLRTWAFRTGKVVLAVAYGKALGLYPFSDGVVAVKLDQRTFSAHFHLQLMRNHLQRELQPILNRFKSLYNGARTSTFSTITYPPSRPPRLG